MLENHVEAQLTGPVEVVGTTQVVIRSYADLCAKIATLEQSSDPMHQALAVDLERLRPRRSHLVFADAARRTGADPALIAAAAGKPAQILMNPKIAQGGQA